MTARGRFLLLAAAMAVAAGLFATPAAALSCSGSERLMSWPDENPVWEFCWLRPAQSSGSSGSGIELRNVYYNGHLVLKRAHIPILNVEYLPGGCGCFRDWMDGEVRFQSDNVLGPGYSEPTEPPVTVCDTGGSGGDVGSFEGVAAEKLADELILTSQTSAGWYRYIMKWKFHLDGTLEPFIGFAAVEDSCIAFTHKHHAYWRLDFDIDGPDNDVVTEGPNPAPGPDGRSGPRFPTVGLPTEALRKTNKAGITWSIVDSTTHRGYRLVPGPETALPADTFSVGDVWLLKYKANEIDDGGQSGPPCAIKFNNFLTPPEGLSTDLVFWYRTGAYHLGGDLDGCHEVGPTLVPIGDWSPDAARH